MGTQTDTNYDEEIARLKRRLDEHYKRMQALESRLMWLEDREWPYDYANGSSLLLFIAGIAIVIIMAVLVLT